MPGEKLDMTKEEMDRISEALKKEEFRKLLMDYAEELADPEKRRLYEEELTMLESQRGVDMKFIKPSPGFVVKMNDSAQNKVFINVCTSAEIARPEFQYAEKKADGDKVERGQQCSLPYSLSPSHLEKDNKNVECEVYDVVFHPEVLARCSNPKFKEMVVDTAIDGVCSNFKVNLDKTSKKLPKMKFKGTPSSSVIRKRVSEEKSDAFAHLPGRPDFPDLPGEEKKKEKKKEKKQGKEENKKPDDEPVYRMVFREDVNMGNFTNERLTSSGRPTQIVITFSLPLHPSARDVDLDVYPEFLELHSKHYNLDHLTLPYKVDSDNGKAKFDKEKRELVVTLDVIPQTISKEDISNFPESSLVEELPDGQETEDSSDSKPGTSVMSSEPSTSQESPEMPRIPETSADSSLPEPEHSTTLDETVIENGIEMKLDAAVNDVDAASEVSSIEIVPSVDSCISEISDSSTQSIETNPSGNVNQQNQTSGSLEHSSSNTETESIPETSSIPENSFKPISSPESSSPELRETNEMTQSPAESSHENGASSDDSEVAKLTEVKITVNDDKEIVNIPDNPVRFRSRFNVSPVPCSDGLCNSPDPKTCKEPKCGRSEVEQRDLENKDLTIPDEISSVNSGLSSYTDCTLEDSLNVGIRVFQDMSTVTVLLDTVYNNVPEVTLSGKKVWLENDDVTLYLILPHAVTTYTIDMSYDNVCFVLYKQHKSLWSALHIGHSEEEVFSFKFITEENADSIVESFGDPWDDANPPSFTPHISTTKSGTKISYTASKRPCNIPIPCSPDSDGEDPTLKGILKSPHSPPPQSPRSRKVSFNEEVETFVLPSKRSMKGKKRRKNKSGSSSASESSDEASSPSPTSPIQEKDLLMKMPEKEGPSNSTEGLILDSAEDSWQTVTKKKNNKKNKGETCQSNDDKENVIMTQSEAVKLLDPAGASGHKMMLGNSHIYELED